MRRTEPLRTGFSNAATRQTLIRSGILLWATLRRITVYGQVTRYGQAGLLAQGAPERSATALEICPGYPFAGGVAGCIATYICMTPGPRLVRFRRAQLHVCYHYVDPRTVRISWFLCSDRFNGSCFQSYVTSRIVSAL